MEIYARKPKIRGKKQASVQVSDGKLHFYGKSPTGNVSILEFQGCAVERLKSLYSYKYCLTFIIEITIGTLDVLL